MWPCGIGASGDSGFALACALRVRGAYWKTPALVEWAVGRSFAWVDDEIGAGGRALSRGALLLRVDAGRVLGDAD
ncbi:hypothetical protein DP939_18770 [Spongiactinospora rosea]|uniref:Uncharacterized protein n=1 Tax=Spongiactinospora rosea TaxID=2248750 RepID=A0A366LZ06_9ACTN|nr:hypothetical protein DP939_18770 [Spongiactinospora rosea]